MFKAIISILLLAAGVMIFMTESRPYFDDIKQLKEKSLAYDEALDNSKKIKTTTDKLLNKYNSISQEEIDKVNAILPSKFDPIVLAVELDKMLKANDMELKSIAVKDTKQQKIKKSSAKSKKEERSFETVTVAFQTAGSYEDFISFLRNMENSSRLIDINSLKFSSQNKEDYQFDLTMTTYWLKPNEPASR